MKQRGSECSLKQCGSGRSLKQRGSGCSLNQRGRGRIGFHLNGAEVSLTKTMRNFFFRLNNVGIGVRGNVGMGVHRNSMEHAVHFTPNRALFKMGEGGGAERRTGKR